MTSDDLRYDELRHEWLSEAQARMTVTEFSTEASLPVKLVLQVPYVRGIDANGKPAECFDAKVRLDERSVRNLHRVFASWLGSLEDA